MQVRFRIKVEIPERWEVTEQGHRAYASNSDAMALEAELERLCEKYGEYEIDWME